MSRMDLERYYRVIDMMLTMHSKLRDRYLRYGLIMDLIILGSSIILCVAEFANEEYLRVIHIDQNMARIIIGISSIIILLLSLLSLLIRLNLKAEKHSQACVELSWLKLKCREILDLEGANFDKIQEQCRECAWILTYICKIPDSKFLPLKALHKRKIELSKLIDSHEGLPFFLLRLKLFFSSIPGLFKIRKK